VLDDRNGRPATQVFDQLVANRIKQLQIRISCRDSQLPRRVALAGRMSAVVGNTIARRFPMHASDWLSALLKFGLEEAPPSHPWLAKTVELTRRFEVSFYDAAYHALALLHNGLFVTADTRYVNQVSETGSVMALTEWQPPRTRPSRPRRKKSPS
jgi:hypothetical protein